MRYTKKDKHNKNISKKYSNKLRSATTKYPDFEIRKKSIRTIKELPTGIYAKINIYDSSINLESSYGVVGFQMNYPGNIKITSKHSKIGEKGWVMSASNEYGKLLYFSAGCEDPLEQKSEIFKYVGDIGYFPKFTLSIKSGNFVSSMKYI